MPEQSEFALPILSVGGIVPFLAGLQDEQLASLKASIEQLGFETGDERCQILSRQLNCTPRDVRTTLGLLAKLYRFVHEDAEASQSPSESLLELFVSLEDTPPNRELVSAAAARAAVLLERNQIADDLNKLRMLEVGFLQHAVGFSSFIDLRPNFSADRSEITQLVPVIQFRIATESSDGRLRSLVFQLTPAALRELSETIGDTEVKLRLIQSTQTFRRVSGPDNGS